jgi:hypothetical protein
MTQPRVTSHYATCPQTRRPDGAEDCTCPSAPAEPLYYWLDQLHGDVLRAKYRLTENPDREKLADLVAALVLDAKRVEVEWQAYESQQ